MNEFYIILLFLVSLLLYIYYLDNRADKVFLFRKMVLDLSIEYDIRNHKKGSAIRLLKHFKKLPCCILMIFGFKKLKLELYFTDKEIKELKNIKKD